MIKKEIKELKEETDWKSNLKKHCKHHKNSIIDFDLNNKSDLGINFEEKENYLCDSEKKLEFNLDVNENNLNKSYKMRNSVFKFVDIDTPESKADKQTVNESFAYRNLARLSNMKRLSPLITDINDNNDIIIDNNDI